MPTPAVQIGVALEVSDPLIADSQNVGRVSYAVIPVPGADVGRSIAAAASGAICWHVRRPPRRSRRRARGRIVD
jgi:hypothetical protein